METKTFTIVLTGLCPVAPTPAAVQAAAPTPDPTRAEIDEIAELRRIVLEITDPEPTSYTTT
jgi:hypothetical protein